MGDFADDACCREMDCWTNEIEEQIEDPDYWPSFPLYIRTPKGVGPCPICKGETKLIIGKHGPFYGCLKFPKCKGRRGY